MIEVNGIIWHRSSGCNHPVSLEKVPSLIIVKGGSEADKAIYAFSYKLQETPSFHAYNKVHYLQMVSKLMVT